MKKNITNQIEALRLLFFVSIFFGLSVSFFFYGLLELCYNDAWYSLLSFSSAMASTIMCDVYLKKLYGKEG